MVQAQGTDVQVFLLDFDFFENGLKIVNFSQEQKFEYLSSYWMELVETFIVCALDVYLLVAKTLRGDVKDFWRYSTFSDWAKIRKFVNFGGFRVSQNVHISMYLASVHVDLVSVQFTVSGHKHQCEETSCSSFKSQVAYCVCEHRQSPM